MDVKALKRRVRPFVPPPEWTLNHVINRIPLVEARMRAYEGLGVRFEDVSTGTIMLNCEVWSPKRLEVGARTVVGRDVLLDARGGIRLGRDVDVGSYARFMTGKHDIRDPDYAASFDPIDVGDRAWIALNAVVLGGVTVGEGAVVAAGAVVSKDVEPFAVVAGVPAKQIGERTRELRYELNYRPNWL
jgi:maltose O-acetyltransferase